MVIKHETGASSFVVVDPDLGQRCRYLWIRYLGVWYTWRCRPSETVYRWWALCETPIDPHWYSYAEGVLMCPLCRIRRKMLRYCSVEPQHQNMASCIYVPLLADSLVRDEDMDAAEAAYQSPRTSDDDFSVSPWLPHRIFYGWPWITHSTVWLQSVLNHG